MLLIAAADAAATAATAASSSKKDPLGHVKDIVLVEAGGVPVLTMHMVTLVAAATLLVFAMMAVAKAVATGPESAGHDRYVTKGRFSQLIEVIVLGLRDNILEPVLGKEQTKRYLPFLMSLFLFILFNNMLGLVPILDVNHLFGAFVFSDSHWAVIGGTATGNLAVTAALATVAFFVIQAHGIRELGVASYLGHLTGGAPAFVAPLMVVIEIAGLFIKPVALAIRLFANMLAGHTLMAVIGLFGYMAYQGLGVAGGIAITIPAIAFNTAIFFLEIFVGFLQSFIFMFLVAIFISQLSHHDHEHDHDHDHGDTDLRTEPGHA